MKTETTFYCEGPGCERCVTTASSQPMAFMRVYETLGAEPMYFCGWDCAMKLAATFPPEEIIPMENG